MRIKVYIVTYKKNDVLNNNLRTLWNTARKPDDIASVTVISNHPDVVIAPENQRPNLRVLVNATRAANSWGYLSRDWNFGIQDAFVNWRNPNNVDWCVLAQNDVEWVDGWDEFLRGNTKYDLVTQPAGDQSIALRIEAVLANGFFDERFCTLHFHEFDYFFRAIVNVGDRASLNGVPPKEIVWNPVGCVLTQSSCYGFDHQDETMHTPKSWSEMHNLLRSKWNFDDWSEAVADPSFFRGLRDPGFVAPREANWYPFFWDGCSDTAGATAAFLYEYRNATRRDSLMLSLQRTFPAPYKAARRAYRRLTTR